MYIYEMRATDKLITNLISNIPYSRPSVQLNIKEEIVEFKNEKSQGTKNIIHYFIPCKFFTAVLTGGLSLESE